MATSEHDLKAIQQELVQTGYIKHKKTNNKKERTLVSHFTSSPQTALIYLLAKTIFKMKNLHLKLPQETIGGSIAKLSPVHTLL